MRIKIDLLNIEITFDNLYTPIDIEKYLIKLIVQLSTLPIDEGNIEKEKQLIHEAAEQRLKLINSVQEQVDNVLKSINKFKVNYSNSTKLQEVYASRINQLMKFELFISRLSPTIEKLYTLLSVTNGHPAINTAITKKLNQCNRLAKMRTMELLDSSLPSVEEDALRYRLTRKDIEILIVNKNQKRGINCHVIDGDTPISVTEFLENIRQNGPKRTQLIYKIAGTEHWSTMDIQRDAANKMNIFFIDAIGHTTNLPKIVDFCTQHKFELTCSMGGLQKDFASCSIFCVDHAFHMSKIADLHEQISAIRKPVPKSEFRFDVDSADLPPVLVKNSQSTSYIKNYLQRHQNYQPIKINNKNQTLLDYAESHHVLIDGQKIYSSILYKQSQYRKKINQNKGYGYDPESHNKLIQKSNCIIDEATQELMNIKVDFKPRTTLNAVAFYYQVLLQQIEEIRTQRALRDAQTILNLRQLPLAFTNAITKKQNQIVQAMQNAIKTVSATETSSSPIIRSSQALSLQSRCITLDGIHFNKYLTHIKNKTNQLTETIKDTTNVTLIKAKELCDTLEQAKHSLMLDSLTLPLKQVKNNFLKKCQIALTTARTTLDTDKAWAMLIKKFLIDIKTTQTSGLAIAPISMFAKSSSAQTSEISINKTEHSCSF